ncbi:MAG: peptidylprolyl isomerase [Clostridiaceae bacterium]|nr:peptidylprolyl isomerase [Clostridiaceae bacterium]
MKCKNCGAEAEEGRRYCTSCGEPLEIREPADSAEAYANSEPQGSDSFTGAGSEDPPAPKHPKKSPHGVIALILAAAAALTVCAGLFFTLRSEKSVSPETEGGTTVDAPSDESGSTALVDDAPLPTPNTVVAVLGDHKLDNETFLFYYWDEFYYIYKQYGTSITYIMDPTQSFATQEYADGVSWRSYLTDRALETWSQTMTLCDAANAAGFSLSEDDQADLSGIPEQLQSYASNYGYTDGESYLRASYDDVVTVDGFVSYLNSTYLASGYVNAQYTQLLGDHLDLADQKKYNVQVRHILIQPAETTDASKSEAKTEAERIYALWQENPTEDNFAALAEEYSSDEGSNTNGGLYDDVTPGQMEDAFNDWCFDESRQVGDHGIVETDYGYHIMYFSGYSDTAYESAQETAAGEDYDTWINTLLEDISYVRTENEIGFSK